MKNKRERRKRIDPAEIIGAVAIDDQEAFIKNKSSDNVKKIMSISERFDIEVYFDKHYYIRHQHGDQEGKREGIEFESVKHLIVEAAKHLLFYSLRVKGFTFVNFEGISRPERIVLTQLFDGDSDLNIVAEYHYLSMHKFEVTLVTAMRKDDFYFNDGVFQVKILPDDSSLLLKNEKGKILKISECDNL